MGWDRITLKQRGKNAFGNNYGNCVLVSFVIVLFTNTNLVQVKTNFENIGIHFSTGTGIKIALVSWILSALIFEVLRVGGCRFYVENRDYSAPASKMFFGFNCGHYGNVVGTMFLKNLKVFLWSLLLVIPGIVKEYEYRMVPYILAEQPDISPGQAFAISRDMMMGNKADAFILDLSFIGWTLLAGLTCGLVGIFWVEPYQMATNTELYTTLRNDWMSRYGQTEQI